MDNIITIREQRQKIFNGKYTGCNCLGDDWVAPCTMPCIACPIRDCAIEYSLYDEIEPRNFVPRPRHAELETLYPLWENAKCGTPSQS